MIINVFTKLKPRLSGQETNIAMHFAHSEHSTKYKTASKNGKGGGGGGGKWQKDTGNWKETCNKKLK